MTRAWALGVGLLLLLGCQSQTSVPDGAGEAARQERGKAALEAVRKTPVDESAQKAVKATREAPPKTVCDGMFALLKKCNSRSPAFRDPRFKVNFIGNCEEERSRPTAYAKLFATCAASTTCDGLKSCSEDMRAQALELGAEHVDYLLKNTEREAAMKFCDDHRKLMTGKVELERRCLPLLSILDDKRKEHEHDSTCNH
jgi:hypothetical protein